MNRPVYNAKLHPKVREGRMTEEEVFVDFMKSFGDANGDATITKKVTVVYFTRCRNGMITIRPLAHRLTKMRCLWAS